MIASLGELAVLTICRCKCGKSIVSIHAFVFFFNFGICLCLCVCVCVWERTIATQDQKESKLEFRVKRSELWYSFVSKVGFYGMFVLYWNTGRVLWCSVAIVR